MRRWILRVGARALSTSGLLRSTAEDLLRTLARFKSRLFLLLLTSMAAPVAEIAFIGTLYALVSPGAQSAVTRRLDGLGLRGVYEFVDGDARFWIVLVSASVAALVLLIALRLLEQLTLTYFKYYLDVTYMHRVVAAYLWAPPAAILRVDRRRVSSAVLHEAVGYGTFAFNMLTMASLAISVALFLASALTVSVQLLLVASVLAALTIVAARRAYRQARAISTRRVGIQADLVGRLFDIVQAFRVVKVEGGEARVSRRMREYLFQSQRWRIDKGHNQMFVTLVGEGLLYAALLAIVALSLFVLHIDSAVILVFLVLMSRLQKYLAGMQQHWLQMRAGAPSLEAVQAVIAACGSTSDERRAEPKPAGANASLDGPIAVRLDRVCFSYPTQPNGDAATPEQALRNVSLECRPGDRVLIQGPSGQGKSTLVGILSGLLPPTSGTVLWNDAPLDDARFLRLRDRLAYAAPDLHVFRDSIRANLCVARDCSVQELELAVRQARLDSVVAGLPQGLDSVIGENGNQLSLGERQRVMLARVFLKRPALVLLDEATSNLDLHNERAILTDLLAHLDPEAIVIMVTHRAPVGIPFTRTFDLHHGTLRARGAADVTATPR